MVKMKKKNTTAIEISLFIYSNIPHNQSYQKCLISLDSAHSSNTTTTTTTTKTPLFFIQLPTLPPHLNNNQ